MSKPCPICREPSEQGGGGDYRQVRCPRCGPYVITLTARAMLGARIEDDPAVVARLSYAVRHRTSEGDWLNVNSSNLDDLIGTRLPTLAVQVINLLNWMAEILDDDRLGSVRAPPFNDLSAVVGAKNGQRVAELVEHAISDGLIKMTNDGGWGITPRGWARLDEPEPAPARQPAPPSPTTDRPEIVLGECPVCGPRRRAEVVASHTERDPPDDDVYETTTLSVLKCGGCGSLYARREVTFSEDQEQEQNPRTGEWETVSRPTTTYWPPYARRSRPPWFPELTDETIRRLLDETYTALNENLFTVAGMGVRAVLDRAFELAGADPGGRFDEKLNSLRDDGVIGADEHATFVVLTDAGSAAVHRGWRPEPEQLETILVAAEDFLNRVAVMPSKIETLRQAVPPRPSRPRRRGRGDARGTDE
ncbi:DUF4145 domain-containing protein [Sphingomonas sp.]|uniref:DUF4145 domain-containing protein n=1 Tax=Sphingomonas sp. TaxID=28214 RepID=UPI0034331A00